MTTKNKLLLQSQSGAALVIALIILIVLTAISLSSSITSITEIKLSGNKRGSTDAFYTADGGIQATIAYLANFDSSTYTLIANTGSISPDIINQSVDTWLTQDTNSKGYKIIFADGVAFTPPPNAVIYHQTSTGAPRGVGVSATGNVGFEYYIIDSIGKDQTGTDLLRSQSEVVTTVVRVYPSQLGGN